MLNIIILKYVIIKLKIINVQIIRILLFYKEKIVFALNIYIQYLTNCNVILLILFITHISGNSVKTPDKRYFCNKNPVGT